MLAVWVALFTVACGNQQQANQAVAPSPIPGAATTSVPASIRIDSLNPNATIEGKAFNPQPDGQAALSIVGASIPEGATLLWREQGNDQALDLVGGGKLGWAAATVPAKLYGSPGTATLLVRSPDGKVTSNALEFTVYSKTGPAPEIAALNPASPIAGQGFNVQPGGESALGLTGTGFLPGAVVMLDGQPMKTVFSSGVLLGAVIPAALTARARLAEVRVLNPDGKASRNVPFKIAKQ